MTLKRIPSIFNKNKSSTLSKRSTISSKPAALEETIVPPTLTRSNTTLSKVKRFGSLLVARNKKTERPTVESIFTTSIDTSLTSSCSLSSNTHSSSDEEDAVTPTPTNMTFSEEELIFKVSTPTTVIEDIVTPEIQYHTKVCDVSPSLMIALPDIKKDDTPSEATLSGVSLVRYHLNLALKEAEEEIEQELESCHHFMLQSIHTKPIISL